MLLLTVLLLGQILHSVCHRIALLTEVDGRLVREMTTLCLGADWLLFLWLVISALILAI